MSKIGIAVLGYAHGHVQTYTAAIKGFDDAQVLACWDHDRERGQAVGAQYGVEFQPDLERVLSRRAVDLVMIGSETKYHPDLVEAAAAAGKDIVLQKPMALSLADCDRIIRAVEQAGVWFSLAYQMRYDPANRKMKELMDAGAIGRVGLVRRRHCIPVLLNEGFIKGPTRWHIDPELNMGMWMDDASHPADLFYWWFGMPSSVVAEIDNVLTNVAADDSGLAIYRWPSGLMAYIFNSSVVLVGENTTEIYGDRGVIIQNYGDGPSCALPILAGMPAVKLYQADQHDAGWQHLGIAAPAGGHGERIWAVARGILDDYRAGKPRVSAAHGKASIQMILGAYQAAREGRRVPLPLA